MAVEDAVTVGEALIAGTKTGISISKDGGLTWTSSSSLSGLPIGSLLEKDGVVFAAVVGAEGGVFASTDAGATFTRVDPGLTTSVTGLVAAGSDVFVSVPGQGVWKSGRGAGDVVSAVGDALHVLGESLIVLDNFVQIMGHAEATVGAWRRAAPGGRAS